MRASLVASFACVVVAGVAACPAPVIDAGCKSDLDCGSSQRCDAARAICLCIDDNACDAAEFCNLAGSCQLKLECLNNTDCRNADAPSDICDTTGGECVTLSASLQCVLDSQCPFGSYCDNQRCATGCRVDGDCNLGDPCINGQCDPTPGACTSNAFCDFGQICSGTRCVDHVAADQLCTPCGQLDPTNCITDCLIDSSVVPTPCTTDAQCDRGACLPEGGGGGGGVICFGDDDCETGETCEGTFLRTCTSSTKICQGFFCGADQCDDVTNPCPRGYTCFTLQVVSSDQCPLGSGTSVCGAPRSCVGGGENGAVGFCSCASDADCPIGAGASCVNPGPNGSCVVGSTCGPSDGLLCEDLR